MVNPLLFGTVQYLALCRHSYFLNEYMYACFNEWQFAGAIQALAGGGVDQMFTDGLIAHFKRTGEGNRHIHQTRAIKPRGCVGHRGNVFTERQEGLWRGSES